MVLFRSIFIAIIYTLLALCCAAQNISFRHYTVKDGIAGSMVYDVLQDKNGFIWLATNQGVSRFDGKTFKNFSKEDGLPDNEVLKLYLDRNNNIWFISLVGIPAVYTKGKIIKFENCPGTTQIVEDLHTDSICFLMRISNHNSVTVGGYSSSNTQGIWKFNGDIKKVVTDKDHVLVSPQLRISNKSGYNFFSSSSSIKNFSVHIKGIGFEKKYTLPGSYIGYNVTSVRPKLFIKTTDSKTILIDNSDSLYLASEKQCLPVLSLRSLQLNINSPADVNSIFYENDSTLWLATRNRGLLKVSNFMSKVKKVERFFGESFCSAIIKDKENGYWVTTLNDGVYYLPNKDFKTLPNFENISDKNIKCIRNYDDKTFATGCADGTIYSINHQNITVTPFSGWKAPNKNNRVLDVAPFGQGRLLAGCDEALYIISKNKITKIDAAAIKNIFILNNDAFLVSSAVNVTLHNVSKKNEMLLYNQRGTCVNAVAGKFYWGTLQGMYEYADNTVKNLGEIYPALKGVINRIDIAPDSSIWVCTNSGIVILRKGVITQLKKEQSLASDLCKQISFDQSVAWVATDKGISRISYIWKENEITFSVSNITEEDGLSTNDVNQTAVGGNNIWAATATGILFFPKSYESLSAISPDINITKIVAGGKTLTQADTILIKEKADNLTIELAGISYRSGKLIQYEYRFTELSKVWIPVSNNTVEFSSLPYGDYHFEARAIDRWGVSSAQPKIIYIIHKQPFWKTTGFTVFTYLLTALLIAGGFFFYYRRRQLQQEKQYALKKKMYELETMALRSQMNPHFIFNSLNSISNYILKADIANANLYLSKFSTLIRKILQHSQNSQISLSEEIKLLQVYLDLEKLRFGDKINFNISVSEGILQEDISIPSMIIQPYIENAVKHGIAPLLNRGGNVTVDFKQADNCLLCTIEDDGIGINVSKLQNAKAGEHHSMGTDIIQNRIDIINTMRQHKIVLTVIDKKDSNPTQTGTIIKLSFPLVNE